MLWDVLFCMQGRCRCKIDPKRQKRSRASMPSKRWPPAPVRASMPSKAGGPASEGIYALEMSLGPPVRASMPSKCSRPPPVRASMPSKLLAGEAGQGIYALTRWGMIWRVGKIRAIVWQGFGSIGPPRVTQIHLSKSHRFDFERFRVGHWGYNYNHNYIHWL